MRSSIGLPLFLAGVFLMGCGSIEGGERLPDAVYARTTWVGNNGRPADAFPLQECQGDCDNDSECAGTLKCGQRNAFEEAPGCGGGRSDGSKTDYCYDPNVGGGGQDDGVGGDGPSITRKGNNGRPADAFPLQECQGDCDRDSDCAGAAAGAHAVSTATMAGGSGAPSAPDRVSR